MDRVTLEAENMHLRRLIRSARIAISSTLRREAKRMEAEGLHLAADHMRGLEAELRQYEAKD